MEDLVAAMKSMAASLEAVKSTVDDSQSILKELVAWRPQVDGAKQEVRADINSDTSSPDGALPAKCSTLGLSPSDGGVEAVESSQQSGFVSMVSPGPVGAPPPSTMQQFSILKPDKHTPTICSTVVLDMGSDAMKGVCRASTALPRASTPPAEQVQEPASHTWTTTNEYVFPYVRGSGTSTSSVQAYLVFEEVQVWSRSSFSSGSIGMIATCMVYVHSVSWRSGGFSPGSAAAQSSRRRYSDGDQVQPILMLSISVPWDPGVCNEPSTKVWQFKLKTWPDELKHQCSSVMHHWPPFHELDVYLPLEESQKILVKETRELLQISVLWHSVKKVLHSSGNLNALKATHICVQKCHGVNVKHQGASCVEHTTTSMGQESTLGKCVMMGMNRLIYALKYARSKADQLLARFWHPFALPVVQLSLTYRLSLVEEPTLVVQREYLLVPINEEIYQLYLQIRRVELSWLEPLCFCEPWRSWCFVQCFGVLAEYYATIVDDVLHWEVPIIHKLCFFGILINTSPGLSTTTQASLVMDRVWRFPYNTLHLHQWFPTYSYELVALGGDCKYYVDEDLIKKPNAMVGTWVPEVNNTITTQSMIKSEHEENQTCVGKPFHGNDRVCEKIWVEDQYTPWDPGGHDVQAFGHRLEGKPDVKEGRMSRTNLVLGHGLYRIGLVEHRPNHVGVRGVQRQGLGIRDRGTKMNSLDSYLSL